MKTAIRILVMAASAGVGLAAGLAWRAHTTGNRFDEAIIVETGNLTNGISKSGKANAPESAEVDDFADKLAKASPVERWLCWMSELEEAKAEDYPKLARMARSNPAIWRFVVNRWIKTAPKSLFEEIVAEEKAGKNDLPLADLSRQLLSQWAEEDPKAVVAALNGSDGAKLQNFRMDVTMDILTKDPELGLQLLREWHIQGIGLQAGVFNAWTDTNPQHAAEVALANPSGKCSEEALAEIGAEWAKNHPTTALAFATSHPGGQALSLAAGALKQWAAQDLQAAGTWLAGADDQTRGQLSPAFIETWAKQDGTAALAWAEDNLQGIQLNQAVNGVMKGAVANDPNAAAALVTSMEPSEARMQAAAYVGMRIFPMGGTTGPVPSTATDWLAALDPDSIEKVLGQISFNWSRVDPEGMANFLGSLGQGEIPPYTDSMVAQSWARTDPQAAMDWAASLPETQALSVARAGFSEWQRSQPDAAAAWLNGLAMNDPRRAAFGEK